MLAIALLLVCFWLSWLLLSTWCPPAATLLQRVSRFVWRKLSRVVWSYPMRTFGPLLTVLFWLFGIGVVLTLTTLLGGSTSWLGLILWWAMIVAVWRGLRWYHEWRYRPRPLPQRHRQERGDR